MSNTETANKIAEVSADVGSHDPDRFVIDFNEDGDACFVFDEQLADLCYEGEANIYRASHVEPRNRFLRVAFHVIRSCVSDNSWLAEFTRQWKITWRVNMGPVGGPTYGEFRTRKEALDSEREWLYENLGY